MFSYFFYVLFILILVYWVNAPQLSLNNSLIIRKHPAEVLEDWLKRFQFGHRSELQENIVLPRYKFYTEVLEVLLSLARKMGGNYQEPLLFLREGLQADRQFERRLREMVLGCWLQMGLMMALTWAFILGALFTVDVKVAAIKLLGIFAWEVVGLSLLPLALRKYRKKYFGEIGTLWKMLYILKSLSRIPLARTEIFHLAGIQELKTIRQKSLEPLVEKLKHTCKECLKVGASYETEVKTLMDELRFQEKWHFELFEKRLTVIKLALISLFFLPSYLAFIFFLLSDLMKIM